jgi:hypothetical protein
MHIYVRIQNLNDVYQDTCKSIISTYVLRQYIYTCSHRLCFFFDKLLIIWAGYVAKINIP